MNNSQSKLIISHIWLLGSWIFMAFDKLIWGLSSLLMAVIWMIIFIQHDKLGSELERLELELEKLEKNTFIKRFKKKKNGN